jgi:transposase
MSIRDKGDRMGQAITVTRTEHTAEALRVFAAKSGDGAQVRRLLAIALILEGRSRTEAAALSGMERQTLRDWVHRYNAEGIAGLADLRRSSGRPPFLGQAQMAELKELVIQGPDPETDRVVRWRCVDLRGEVIERFTVTVHERTIGKWLRKLKFTRMQPRPFHPKKDAEAQEAFKKSLAGLLKYYLLSSVGTTPIEIWFQSLPSGLTRGTKPGSGKRALMPMSGHRSAHDRQWSGTTATTPHISMAQSVPPAGSVRLSSCRQPTPKA